MDKLGKNTKVIPIIGQNKKVFFLGKRKDLGNEISVDAWLTTLLLIQIEQVELRHGEGLLFLDHLGDNYKDVIGKDALKELRGDIIAYRKRMKEKENE